MTITQRYMFSAVVALGMLGTGSAFARTDNNYTNLPNYAESFENLAAWGGVYTNINITNGWYSVPNTDNSVITNMPYSFTNACGFPIPGATHTNVLQLNTQGAILTNSFTANNDGASGFNMASTIVNMDTMVQFVPSQATPAACTASDSGIKAAVFVNATSNLVVYHGMCDTSVNGAYLSGQNTNDSINAVTLSTSAWYRLTIVFDATCVPNFLQEVDMFQVLTNGTAVQSSNAYDSNWKSLWQADNLPQLSPTGTWFRSATYTFNPSLNKLLTAIAFQGTGYIDDLVVTTNSPSFSSGVPSYLLTVVAGSNGSASPLGAVSVLSGTTTNVVFSPNQWFQIASLTTNGISVPAAIGSTNFTLSETVNGPLSNNVTFVRPTYTITLNPSANASGPTTVLNGQYATNIFTANTYWFVNSVSGAGTQIAGGVGDGFSSVTLAAGPVTTNISETVTFFRPNRHIAQTIGANGSGNSGTNGDILVANGASTAVTYTASNWYYSTVTAGQYGSASGNGSSAATATFTTVQSNTTVSASFTQKGTGAVVSNVPSSWGIAAGVTEGWATTHPLLAQESYMLGLTTTNVNPGLTINGISVNGSSVNVTVQLDNNNSPLNTTLAGTLRLYATANLANSFAQIGAAPLAAFTNSGTYVVSFTDANTNDFYKTAITLP